MFCRSLPVCVALRECSRVLCSGHAFNLRLFRSKYCSMFHSHIIVTLVATNTYTVPWSYSTQLRTYCTCTGTLLLASQNCPGSHETSELSQNNRQPCGKPLRELNKSYALTTRFAHQIVYQIKPATVEVECKVWLTLTQDESSTPSDPFLHFVVSARNLLCPSSTVWLGQAGKNCLVVLT